MSNLFYDQYCPISGSFQSITLDDQKAISLKPPETQKRKLALIQVLGSPANWRDDGVDPTGDMGGGMFMDTNEEPMGFNGNLHNIRFISTSSGGSTLLVSYYQ